MAEGVAAFDEAAWQLTLVAALEGAFLKKYSVTLRRPVIMRRAEMDAPARVVFPPHPGLPQIWVRGGGSDAERQAAFVQALAGIGEYQLPVEANKAAGLGSARWALIVKFLRGDDQAPCVVEMGLPPNVESPTLADAGEQANGEDSETGEGDAAAADNADTQTATSAPAKRGARPTIAWQAGKGRRLDVPEGVVQARPIDPKLSKHADVVAIKKFFAPRTSVWWGVCNAGPIGAVDIAQVAMKNYVSTILKDAPYGRVKYPLQHMVKTTLGVRAPNVGDVVVLFGTPPQSSSYGAVSAAGLWRSCKRVGDQLQYQVQIAFVWCDLGSRGAFRKLLITTLGALLAADLDRIAKTEHDSLKLDSVVARVIAEPVLDTCYGIMTGVVNEFDRRCKKRRGGVPFGGVDNAVVMPPLLAASRRK